MQLGKNNDAVDSVAERTAPGGNDPLSIIAAKACKSLHKHQAEAIKSWIGMVIDELGLAALENFPTKELTRGFPLIIERIALSIKDPGDSRKLDDSLMEAAVCLASIRREKQTLDKLIEDYMLLKKLLLKACTDHLRQSDRDVLAVFQRLDDGFSQFLRIGLQTYLDQHSRKLQHLANTDALTGLFNVRYFRRQLHHNLELYKRYKLPFSLMMLDLDDFKVLNDSNGHNAGDRALKNLALIMEGEKRETDVAVRYGGDEFFLLLPSTTMAEAERLARRISSRARGLNLSSNGSDITGVSIGLVSCPAHGSDVGALRSKADRALYLAKSLGGGSVACYRQYTLKQT